MSQIEYACCPEDIADNCLAGDRRVLLLGETGSGKSTLATSLARAIKTSGRSCELIGADPGSPVFGVPGAVCRGTLEHKGWHLYNLEPLCSLDAGRFRLPLITAVRRLTRRLPQGVLLVDAPGVIRGVAAAELATYLIEAAAIDMVMALVREDRQCPLFNELAASGAEIIFVRPVHEARHPGKRARRRQRTRLWDAYLLHSKEIRLPLSAFNLIGTPPPLDTPEQWTGRQIALLKDTTTLGMGEVLRLEPDGYLHLRLAGEHSTARQLLVRDARRDDKGWLGTAKPFASTSHHYLPPPDITPYAATGNKNGPCPVAVVATASAILVNGVFGDPLLHLRLGNRKQSLLFDLGEGVRLPARISHQITDVFISHAHFDHISGFVWLLRSRIGTRKRVRIFGPPGLVNHIAGMIQGILWDRIGVTGPRFEICELHGDRLHAFHLQAGKTDWVKSEPRRAPGGVLLEEPSFTVRATVLDHGTPVLAYGFEHAPELSLCKKSLAASGLQPGPWIRELKHSIASGNAESPITLPDGTFRSAARLAAELLEMTPRQKLVYATDLADTPLNREKITNLARDAHTLFCEASFVEADRDYARQSGHLTARACGEIATAAGVDHLIPFHFSRRYERNPTQLYNEIRAVCSRVVEPSGGAWATT